MAVTFPKPSPDFRCRYDLTDLESCLAQNGLNFTRCTECQFSYHDSLSNGTDCGEINDRICESFDACYADCGSCGEQIEVIETYSWGYECYLGCPSLPWLTNPNPAPAPAPIPAPAPAPALSLASFPIPTPSRCTDEVNRFSTCVARTGDVPSCYACFDANIPDSVSTCEASRSYVCAADEICPTCGRCQDEFEAVINCANVGYCEPFDCFTTGGGRTSSSIWWGTCTGLSSAAVGMIAVSLCPL